jgi:uncharacterized protein (TIGR03032 family)
MPTDTGPDSPFRSAHTPGFAGLLEELGITLLVTTYQAGKLMAVRAREGRIATLLRSFDRPMGLAVREPGRFALGTRNQVWLYRDAPDVAPQVPPAGRHDACYLPRISYVTGDIRCHDVCWAGDELWVVNTLFSCLCTLSPDHSFVPRWHPPFLPGPAPGDHCHLNGLAVAGGRPRYVTALGDATTPEGWREGRAAGGLLLDVASGTVVSRGLSMPHSPRVAGGRLWLLESGTGELQTVDPAAGTRTAVARLPGFARGLTFWGRYAFVGLSRVRESNLFGGLPITARGEELRCGIWAVDVPSGEVAGYMQFEAGVEEVFAVEVLPGTRFPEVVGFQQDTVSGAFVVPPR